MSCGTLVVESRAGEIEERVKATSALSQVKMSMELRHGLCAGRFVSRYHWSSLFLVRSNFRCYSEVDMCTNTLDGTDATVMGAGMPNKSRMNVIISSGRADCGWREAPAGKLSCSCNHECCLQAEPPFFQLQGLFTVAQRSIRSHEKIMADLAAVARHDPVDFGESSLSSSRSGMSDSKVWENNVRVVKYLANSGYISVNSTLPILCAPGIAGPASLMWEEGDSLSKKYW